MKISKKKKTEIFKSIDNPIMDLRIENNKGLSNEEIDTKLFHLTLTTHKNILKTLGVKDE